MRSGVLSLLLWASFCLLSAAPALGFVLAPGLYAGHPPAGRVSPNNVLTRPHGRSKGIVMVVHGGGWLLVGKDALATPVATWFNRHGYSAYDVDYRVGQDSLVDVVAAYDYLRDRFGSHVKICAYGQSAGGQLVELLAASRPSLSCVISEAGVEDVRASATQCAYQHEYCGWLAPADYLVWGDRLWEFSPVRVARFIHQPFLAAGSSFDPLIDEPAQLAEMKQARPQTQTMLLQGSKYPAGWAENFMHASVTTAALGQFHRAVLQLLMKSVR